MNRRDFIALIMGAVGLLALPKALLADAIQKLVLSNDEWKKKLSPEAYHVLREEGTEAPFTSPLLYEKREGVFACVACDLALFPSAFKYDSGTGWPSFFDVNPGVLETKTDYLLLIAPRTEYHCARCDGHHGHVFNDGPKPTGLRYCSNGVALKFVPCKVLPCKT